MDKAIKAASLTSGNEINEESMIAININPGAPQGSKVSTSQRDMECKNDIFKTVESSIPVSA